MKCINIDRLIPKLVGKQAYSYDQALSKHKNPDNTLIMVIRII